MKQFAYLTFTLLICGAILIAGNQISVTLDEVCPTVDEGTDFLLTRSG